jgi:hypothetical protein
MPKAHAYSCLSCAKTFAFAGTLAAHTQVRHARVPAYICLTCKGSKTFASADALRSHVKAKHTRKDQYLCAACSPRKKFATADALRAHTAAKHRDGPASTPARSAWSNYAMSELDAYGLVGVDSDGDFECIGGCAGGGLAMCKNCP